MPPLPTFYTFPKVADLAGCSRQAVHNAVRDGKLASITVAGHLLIEKEAAEIWIRDWPTKYRGRGVAKRWAEYRSWKKEMADAARAELVSA